MNFDYQIRLFNLICELQELAKKNNDIEVAKAAKELAILFTSKYEREKNNGN